MNITKMRIMRRMIQIDSAYLLPLLAAGSVHHFSGILPLHGSVQSSRGKAFHLVARMHKNTEEP